MAAGKKTGGRQKGAKNKTTVEKREAIAAAGLTPLDYMLAILRDEKQAQEARFAAAKDAAPYCHAKLAAVTIGGDPDAPLTTINRIELVAPGHDDSAA